MKVRVEPEVETGTDKGGEDLHLRFTATHEGDTPPVGEDLEVELAVADDYDVEAKVTDGDYDAESGERFWPKAKVKYRTYHYDFEWEGTGDDVLGETLYHDNKRVTVEQYLRNPDTWSFCHKPGEPPRLTSTGLVFCDGNAD